MQALIVIGVFVFANLVAAGVWQVQYTIFARLMPEVQSPWPLLVFALIAALSAIFFVRGAIETLAGVHSRLRRGGKVKA